jgi:hypothetical protein
MPPNVSILEEKRPRTSLPESADQEGKSSVIFSDVSFILKIIFCAPQNAVLVRVGIAFRAMFFRNIFVKSLKSKAPALLYIKY